MTHPSHGIQRYLFARHSVDRFSWARDLIGKHQSGDGVRAALTVTDEHGELYQVFAVQGIDEDGVDGHTTMLMSHDTNGPAAGGVETSAVQICLSEDCLRGVLPIPSVNPMELPPLHCLAFLVIRLAEGAITQFVPPCVRSLTAGFATDGGRGMFIQLASRDRRHIDDDIMAWRSTEGVEQVTVYLGSGDDLVRSIYR